jgi:hypothetical protein
MKCSCYNPLHQTGEAEHVPCGGTGFLNIVEKIRAINHGMGVNFEIGDFRSQEIGHINSNFQVFYTRHNVKPNVRDFILVAGFNGEVPVNVMKVYEITAVDEIRGDNGRIELNMLLTKARPDMVSTYQAKVKSLKRVIKNRGRVFLCP